jgi:hypothetical protein
MEQSTGAVDASRLVTMMRARWWLWWLINSPASCLRHTSHQIAGRVWCAFGRHTYTPAIVRFNGKTAQVQGQRCFYCLRKRRQSP